MAIRFDNIADKLSRTATLPPITTFTMMGWFKISADSGGSATFLALGGGTDTATDYLLQGGWDAGAYELVLYNVTAPGYGSAITIGTWAHLAMTVAGTGAGQCLAYRNGVLEITVAGNAAIAASALTLNTHNYYGDIYNNGCVAGVKIYNVALSAAEIQDEMYSYAPQRLANLNSWYPLLLHTDVVDRNGGTALTVGGTLTTEDGPPITWGPRSRRYYVAAAAGVILPRRPIIMNSAVARAAHW